MNWQEGVNLLWQKGGSFVRFLQRLYPNELVESKDNEARNNPKYGCFISINKKIHYSLYIANNLNELYISDNIKITDEMIDNFGILTIFCDACKKKSKSRFRLYMK